MPNLSDFSQFIHNDIDVDYGDNAVTVSKSADFFTVNNTYDSLYVYYYPGRIESTGSVLWGGVTHVAIPYDPIAISNYADLKKIGTHVDYPLYSRYRIANDIDASLSQSENGVAGFQPIGNDSDPFTGSFDGAGNAIFGLHINRPSAKNVGVEGNVVGAEKVGLLIGQMHRTSTVINCYTDGAVSGDDYVGGIVGQLHTESTIINSHSSATVTGEDYIGGLVGNVWWRWSSW